MSYGTVSELRTWLGISGTADDAALSLLLDAVEAAIDQYTDRHFRAETKTRYYGEDDLDDQVLYIFDDDLLTLTSLTNGDGVAILTTNCWLEPRNDTPYWAIRLKSGYYWSFITDGWIIVTGTWGYSVQPPASVVRASMLWASGLWNTKTGLGLGGVRIDDYEVTYNPGWAGGGSGDGVGYPPAEVRALLDPLVRRR